jgi:hypothetical protein
MVTEVNMKPTFRALGFVAAFFLWFYSPQASAQSSGATGGPLHAKARRAGGKLAERLAAEYVINADLEGLAARSDLVVLGKVLTVRNHLTDDRKGVQMDAMFHVQEVLQGSARAGDVIVISVPGGTFMFSDGAVATQYAQEYHPLQKNGTYALFLRDSAVKVPGGHKAHRLATGIQAQFQLDWLDSTVWPAVRLPQDPLWVRYGGKPIANFLRDLHGACDTVPPNR